ncbi:MAG: hypothetical protein JNL53_15470 [Cyclobacteriaceae bacterium]|nr:hypothetical protein [Cyclobacteriaceae bacterium]
MNLRDITDYKLYWVVRLGMVSAFFLGMVSTGMAQEEWGEGEIEKVEIEIVKERQIVLPKANRNFEKVPPRPVEPIKPEITYDFKNIKFATPEFNPAIRPLRLKQEEITKIYGNYFSAGLGNYASPYLDAYITNKRDKAKFYGVKAFHHSFGQGPVDKNNSASGNTEVGMFGKSFGKQATVGGFANYENITTHYYGYTPGVDVDKSQILQSYNIFSLGGDVQNSTTSPFNYKLLGSFSYLDDHYKAKESEVVLGFKGDYEISKAGKILIGSDYYLISRKDEQVEAEPRHIFKVKGGYEFSVMDDLVLMIGTNVVLENDTLGKDKSLHIYPDVRASYPLNKSVEVYASLTGDIDKVSLHSLARENAWLNSNIGINNTNRTIEFLGGIKGKLGSKVSFGGGFGFANLKELYFYQNDPTDRAKFITVFDEGNTKRTNLYGELGFTHAQTARMLLRADLFGYSTDQVAEAWHRPTYRVSFNSSYNLYSKILFNVDLITQGGAKALNVDNNSVVTLDPAIDLNVKASYFLSKKVSVFVKGSNLLSSDYQLYLNYPVRGVQVMGGVTWVF